MAYNFAVPYRIMDGVDEEKQGELPRDCEPSEIVACVVGPLFYRRWFSRQPLDEKFVKHLVEHVTGRSKR